MSKQASKPGLTAQPPVGWWWMEQLAIPFSYSQLKDDLLRYSTNIILPMIAGFSNYKVAGSGVEQ